MKMSEIINDDIISKEKRKSSEWVKPRTSPIARDYFGNKSTQTKPIDREVQKKSRQKEWFEEGQEITNTHQALFNILKSGDADELSNFLRTHSELSNDPAFKTAQKILKTWKEISSDVSNYKSGRQDYQITDEESLDNTLNMTAFEDSVPLDSKYTVCAKGSNQPTLLSHTKHEAEEAAKKVPGSTVRLVVPKTKTGKMGEGSMKAAARKPEGSKFGGYYKGTQKGAPKPNQSFGGTCESTELDEVAPPGKEKLVRQLKKEYPGHPEKAFATAWAIKNKTVKHKGKNNVSR